VQTSPDAQGEDETQKARWAGGKGNSAGQEQFVSMGSHEFRTPLGIIQSRPNCCGFFPAMEMRSEEPVGIHRPEYAGLAGRWKKKSCVSRLVCLACKLHLKPAALDLKSFAIASIDEYFVDQPPMPQ